MSWSHRGYDNMLENRRKELRHMAQTQIAATEQRAIVEIEVSCLDAQMELAVSGLTSGQPRADFRPRELGVFAEA